MASKISGKKSSNEQTPYFMNSDSLTAFSEGLRQVTVPFELTFDGCCYRCDEVLRLLPARRMVALAVTPQQRRCVIKLFVKTRKGRREYERELSGYQLASEADLRIPEMLFNSESDTFYYVVIYDFIEQSKTLSHATNLNQKLDNVAGFIANMHEQGIYQDDIHLDNLLIDEDDLILIDLGSVKTEKQGQPLTKQTSLLNLAKLLAQLTMTQRETALPIVELYYRYRDWQFDSTEQNRFGRLLGRVWQKRKKEYLSKNFRDCSMTHFHHDFHWQYAFRREFWESWQCDDLAEIEVLFNDAKLLKAGNSATVIQREVAGRQVVIKRYNIKTFSHAIRRMFRISRASKSWKNANLLEFIGIPTVKPLGFVEQRWGWFRGTAYFFSEYQPADELLDIYNERQPEKEEGVQIQTLFNLLRRCKIGHGDMKAQNLLLSKTGEVLLIDLDSMVEYRSASKAKNAFNRDKKRFLRNWSDGPLFHYFSTLIN